VITPDNINNIKRIVGEYASVVPFVYGSSEAATLMIGTESGYYEPIKEDFVFELVDPYTHAPIQSKDGISEYSGKLLVTWLRNGLLPILRYDTNDIFHISFHGSQEQWRVKGRVRGQMDKGFSDADIETLIYSAGVPIFHYHCEIAKKNIRITVISIPECNRKDEELKIKEHIRKYLSDTYEVEVYVNPESHEFYDFSISPKMKKLVISN
jgi:phenylacetate-CoA ligase